MTCQYEGGIRYNQVFDAENRLSVVHVMNAGTNCPAPDTESTSVSATTRFYYDGQGNQVKRLDPDGSYTVYFFGMYEIRFGSNAGETIYYPAGGAMRVNGTLKFILSDQLGSTSVVTDAGGAELGRMGYYPFGKTRYSSGSLSTDRHYTGQQEVVGIGLYNYKARFYDAALGRFISADTVTAGGAQGLNKYSYVLNNPANKTDPTGNMACDGEDSTESCEVVTPDDLINVISYEFDWNVEGNWGSRELDAIIDTGTKILNYVNNLTGGNGYDWMHKYLGGTNIAHSADAPSWASWVPTNRNMANPGVITGTGANTVYLVSGWLKQEGGSRWLAHEMAHIWDIKTSPIIPFYGGAGDHLNSAMGGNNMTNICRFCDHSGANNGHPFPKDIQNYGNNSTADYLAESFALSIYPDHAYQGPVPVEAQSWVQNEIWLETYLIFTSN